MVHEAEKRWERVGRSPDFLWGRMCVGGHETRMRRGTRIHRGSRMRPAPSSGGCSTFFSVTGRRCAGHRRRREHGRDRAAFSCWLPPPHHTSAHNARLADKQPTLVSSWPRATDVAVDKPCIRRERVQPGYPEEEDEEEMVVVVQ